jgi:hypothetical protein
MAGRLMILNWRPFVGRGGLIGFVRVQLQSGMIVDEVRVFVRGDQVWCSPPARALATKTGEPLLDARGKQRWMELVSFINHGTRASFSRQVLAALRQQYPDALPSRSAA